MEKKLYLAIAKTEIEINLYEKFSNELVQEAYEMGARHFKQLLITNLDK